ncbi:hypothetical protein [Streptomyces nanshensis]|uniref:hypothetical protein n=1 Tax=Streptomyces nanshensis TaxID=518642 RepID=UPI00085CCCDD|nr:hypothetical protein [Streptomyces nanshensis]
MSLSLVGRVRQEGECTPKKRSARHSDGPVEVGSHVLRAGHVLLRRERVVDLYVEPANAVFCLARRRAGRPC